MAVSWTIDSVHSVGDQRSVHGTFTTASGDSTLTFATSDHGLGHITDYRISLDAGGIDIPNPKITNSGGTLTIVYDDTLGMSGTFTVVGK